MMLHDDIYKYFKSGPLSSLQWICGDEDPHHLTCNGAADVSLQLVNPARHKRDIRQLGCVRLFSGSHWLCGALEQAVQITYRTQHRTALRRGWLAALRKGCATNTNSCFMSIGRSPSSRRDRAWLQSDLFGMQTARWSESPGDMQRFGFGADRVLAALVNDQDMLNDLLLSTATGSSVAPYAMRGSNMSTISAVVSGRDAFTASAQVKCISMLVG